LERAGAANDDQVVYMEGWWLLASLISSLAEKNGQLGRKRISGAPPMEVV
jgi:hypothetical protein